MFGSILATNSETNKRQPKMIYLGALSTYWMKININASLIHINKKLYHIFSKSTLLIHRYLRFIDNLLNIFVVGRNRMSECKPA